MTINERTEIEKLRGELEGAFRNRGDLYRLFFAELTARLGPAEAEQIMVRVVETRGKEVAPVLFSKCRPGDALEVGETFLAVSPDSGRMYPVEVERSPGSISFQVKRCPLKESWVSAGLPGNEVARLCRIAGAFDRGLFEAAGVRFENITWTEGSGTGCCWIRLSDPELPRRDRSP